jgi:epsilon-lactone hydrolase
MNRQADAVEDLYLEWAAARKANPQMSLDEQRDMIEAWPVIAAEPRGIDYIEIEVGGVPALWAVPKGCAQDRVVLCVHGGGFVTGSMYSHRKFYGHLAKAVGCRALIPDYRRSPEHAFPAALDDVVAAYRWLLAQGLEANHIVLAGDSSGGGLIIASQLRARDVGLPMPAASLPISPSLDMAVTGESIASNFGKDALFTKEMIQGLARASARRQERRCLRLFNGRNDCHHYGDSPS